MARYNFGGALEAYVISAGTVVSGGRNAVLRGGVNVWFYSMEQEGTRYTDLVFNGLSVSEVPTKNSGSDLGYFEASFQGPDEIASMWVDANGGSGPRHLIFANEAKVYTSHNQTIAGVKTFTSSPIVPLSPTGDTQVASKNYVDVTSGAGTADATTTVKGKLKLAGDLGGTADLPTVPELADKAADSAVVHLSGAETITGVKTFNASPTVPTPTATTQVANKDYVDTTAGAGTADATTTTKGKLMLAGDLGGTADLPTVPGLASKANDSAVVHIASAETVTGEKTFSDVVRVNQSGLVDPAVIVNQPNTVTGTGDANIAEWRYLGATKTWLNEKGMLRLERMDSEVVLRMFANNNNIQDIIQVSEGTRAIPGNTVARMSATGKWFHPNNDYTAWTEITIDSPTTATKYTANTDGTNDYNSPQVRIINGGLTAEFRGRINVANVTGVTNEVIASTLPTSIPFIGNSALSVSAIPERNRNFAGFITGTGGQRLGVTSLGALETVGSVTGGSATFISLDGLTYSLEQ